MNNFSETLQYLMDKKGMNDSELADLVGVNRSTIVRWRNGIRSPKLDKIPEIASVFGVDPKMFIGSRETLYDISNIYDQLHPLRQKKVYKFAENQLEEQKKTYTVKTCGHVAAGNAIEYGDGFVEERSVSYIPAKANKALVIKGKSMEPEFPDGSVVFYIEQPMVENGEIAIVEIHREAVTCKKIKFDFENQKIVLQSLNSEYGDMNFNSDEVRVLGKVVK